MDQTDIVIRGILEFLGVEETDIIELKRTIRVKIRIGHFLIEDVIHAYLDIWSDLYICLSFVVISNSGVKSLPFPRTAWGGSLYWPETLPNLKEHWDKILEHLCRAGISFTITNGN